MYLPIKGLYKKVKRERSVIDVTIELNKTILDNPKVRIGKKAKKAHIFITPNVAQEEPENISTLKQKVLNKWGYISLLDILKEADLRIGLTSALLHNHSFLPV